MIRGCRCLQSAYRAWVGVDFTRLVRHSGLNRFNVTSAKPAFVIMWDTGKLKANISSNMYWHLMARWWHKSDSYCITCMTWLTYYDVWFGYKQKWMRRKRVFSHYLQLIKSWFLPCICCVSSRNVEKFNDILSVFIKLTGGLSMCCTATVEMLA